MRKTVENYLKTHQKNKPEFQKPVILNNLEDLKLLTEENAILNKKLLETQLLFISDEQIPDFQLNFDFFRAKVSFFSCFNEKVALQQILQKSLQQLQQNNLQKGNLELQNDLIQKLEALKSEKKALDSKFGEFLKLLKKEENLEEELLREKLRNSFIKKQILRKQLQKIDFEPQNSKIKENQQNLSQFHQKQEIQKEKEEQKSKLEQQIENISDIKQEVLRQNLALLELHLPSDQSSSEEEEFAFCKDEKLKEYFKLKKIGDNTKITQHCKTNTEKTLTKNMSKEQQFLNLQHKYVFDGKPRNQSGLK